MSDLLSMLSQTAQMVGVLLIAVQIWPIVRVIRERYLVYWAWGWALLAVGLCGLFLSAQLPPLAAPFRVLYCAGGDGFAFLLWAGSRKYATGRRLHRRDLLWLVPPLGYAVAGPLLLPDFYHLFVWHALGLTGFFAAALWETRRFGPHGRAGLGLRLYQGAVFGLTAVFAHYAGLLAYAQFALPGGSRFPHMTFAPLYDVLLQASLALGMVCIATERMRTELERKNRRLEEAAAELERAARTDPLTGLLNRRGLDELAARPEGLPPGVLAVVDLNDLKPINDDHGHEAGDVALRLVARALRNLFRVTDPIVRMGGDEFLVLMPGGSAEELARRMEVLDACLLNQRLPGVDAAVDVRVAWGVAGYGGAADLPAAMKAADAAMYQQKAARKAGPGGSSPRRPALVRG